MRSFPGRGGMADATDLKSVGPKWPCGFDSRRPDYSSPSRLPHFRCRRGHRALAHCQRPPTEGDGIFCAARDSGRKCATIAPRFRAAERCSHRRESFRFETTRFGEKARLRSLLGGFLSAPATNLISAAKYWIRTRLLL